MNPETVLKKVFKFNSFKDGQKKIINSILNERDVLAIMPSGSGKSICYQIPALLFPHITIVISPRISIMQDKVKKLDSLGVYATYIDSTLDRNEIYKRLNCAKEGIYKIMYITPERLKSKKFMEFSRKLDISMIVVDEIPFNSQKRLNLRPSYRIIPHFIDELQKRPVVSVFTKTQIKDAKDNILSMLNLKNPEIIVNGFDRNNIYYSVEKVNSKFNYTLDYIKKHMNYSGIIYCTTKRTVNNLYLLLEQQGISVTKYHAGMDSETKKKI